VSHSADATLVSVKAINEIGVEFFFLRPIRAKLSLFKKEKLRLANPRVFDRNKGKKKRKKKQKRRAGGEDRIKKKKRSADS